MTDFMVKITRQSHPKLYWYIDKFFDEWVIGTCYRKSHFGGVAGEEAFMVADIQDGEVDSHETQLAKMTDTEAEFLLKSSLKAENEALKTSVEPQNEAAELIEKYHLQDFQIWMQDFTQGWPASRSVARARL